MIKKLGGWQRNSKSQNGCFRDAVCFKLDKKCERPNLSYKRKCPRFLLIIQGNTPQRYEYVDNKINYIFFVVNILCNNIYIYCRIKK